MGSPSAALANLTQTDSDLWLFFFQHGLLFPLNPDQIWILQDSTILLGSQQEGDGVQRLGTPPSKLVGHGPNPPSEGLNLSSTRFGA